MLTVICMHTSYIFCIPLKTKTAQEVIQAYMRHVYSKFSGSEKILSDNGTEFKNTLFKDVAKKLGVEYKVYMPPYRPQCNGKIEGFHRYLKSCIAKTHCEQHGMGWVSLIWQQQLTISYQMSQLWSPLSF